jgi:tRNA pseudouridine38-40 synthase
MAAIPPTSRRIALKVQYLGTNFFGWQRQPRHRSVQGVLEQAAAKLAGHAVSIHGAGRTDTGVHAAGQVAHFDTTSPIPAERWWEVLNDSLPDDVAVLDSAIAAPEWHARFSAQWRRYRYAIWNTRAVQVFWRPFSWQYALPLDEGPMARALQSLLGEHDLDLFRLSGSSRAHSRVRVQSAQCWRSGPLVWVEVQASGFLYRMMRLLVGALVPVGRGEVTPAEFEQMWRKGLPPAQPHLGGSIVRFSVPARGLCLTHVGYDLDPFLGREQTGSWQPVRSFPFACEQNPQESVPFDTGWQPCLSPA